MTLGRRATAEFFGTFWLVFGGCGSAVLAAGFPNLGIGFVGVALAFGLTVLTMAYAIGHISGCHLNPAVTAGLTAGGRFPAAECVPYIIAQVAGGAFGSAVLYVIASGKAGFDLSAGFAANGWRTLSWRILSAGLLCSGSRAHVVFLVHHHGRDGQTRSAGVCSYSNWTRTHTHTSGRNPGDESFREPSTEHRTCTVRAWLGSGSTVALLGRTAHWGNCRRRRLPRGLWRSRHAATGDHVQQGSA